MQIFKYTAMALVATALLSTNSSGQEKDGQLEMLPLECVKVYEDLQFDKAADQSLCLDLYIPEKSTSTPPLLVWIHGGGHNDGKSRLDAMIDLTDKGYAVASFNSWPNGLRTCHSRHRLC